MVFLGLVAQSSKLSLCNTGTDFQMHNWKGSWLTVTSFRTFNSSLLSIQSSCSDFSVTQRLTYIWSPHFYLVFSPHPPSFHPKSYQPAYSSRISCSHDSVHSVLCRDSFLSLHWGAFVYSPVIRLASPPLRTPLCSTLYLLRTPSISHYAPVVYIVSLLLN